MKHKWFSRKGKRQLIEQEGLGQWNQMMEEKKPLLKGLVHKDMSEEIEVQEAQRRKASISAYYIMGLGFMVLMVGLIIYTWYNGYIIGSKPVQARMETMEMRPAEDDTNDGYEADCMIAYSVGDKTYRVELPVHVEEWKSGKVINVYYSVLDPTKVRYAHIVRWPLIVFITGGLVLAFGCVDFVSEKRNKEFSVA